MFQQPRIAPSILSADFMNLESQIRLIEDAGAGFIHVDVMDGHFVPNLSIGVPVVKQLAKIARIPLDVHLMISNPLIQLPWYIAAGSHMITTHVEAYESAEEMQQALAMLREAGVKTALSLKPKTPVDVLKPVLDQLDMVLIMSIEPGFSGQSYIEGSDQKVAQVVSMAQELGCAPLIEVDGGIGLKTIVDVAAAGADVFVCGNAVYAQEDPAAALQTIQAAAEAAQAGAR